MRGDDGRIVANIKRIAFTVPRCTFIKVSFAIWFGAAHHCKCLRVPSEAEWEYACRGGSSTAYSFGDNPSALSDYAWWGTSSDGGNAKEEAKRRMERSVSRRSTANSAVKLRAPSASQPARVWTSASARTVPAGCGSDDQDGVVVLRDWLEADADVLVH
jgi:hypothetical protein